MKPILFILIISNFAGAAIAAPPEWREQKSFAEGGMDPGSIVRVSEKAESIEIRTVRAGEGAIAVLPLPLKLEGTESYVIKFQFDLNAVGRSESVTESGEGIPAGIRIGLYENSEFDQHTLNRGILVLHPVSLTQNRFIGANLSAGFDSQDDRPATVGGGSDLTHASSAVGTQAIKEGDTVDVELRLKRLNGGSMEGTAVFFINSIANEVAISIPPPAGKEPALGNLTSLVVTAGSSMELLLSDIEVSSGN